MFYYSLNQFVEWEKKVGLVPKNLTGKILVLIGIYGSVNGSQHSPNKDVKLLGFYLWA